MKLLLLTVVIDVEFFTKMTPSLRKEQQKKCIVSAWKEVETKRIHERMAEGTFYTRLKSREITLSNHLWAINDVMKDQRMSSSFLLVVSLFRKGVTTEKKIT